MTTSFSSELWQKRIKDNPLRQGDNRTEWGRDLARLIHSSAFRRLQAKTQVLGLGESDFYRTRLTHSMEVAQIGSGLLKVLQEKFFKHEVFQSLPDATLMQSVCLAHDIGHPPFGHGGEVALNFCMRAHGGFEGNGQTLRILSKLEKYIKDYGINPTRRLMLGVLKYPLNYSKLVNEDFYTNNQSVNNPHWLFKAECQKPPKCYLDTEKEIVESFVFDIFNQSDRELFCSFEKIEGKHARTNYKSLDTSIMDLADEISYSLHDLEDSISLGMVTKEKWNHHLSNDKSIQIIKNCNSENFVEDVESLGKKLFGSSYERKDCIGQLINLLITNVDIKVQDDRFSELTLKFTACLPNELELFRKLLFNIVKDEVILNENVQQLEFKGQKLVVELFDVLSTDPERFLPSSTKEKYQQYGDIKEGKRVICDFISGMTDDYATRFYEKIFIPRKGSIFDRL